MPTMFGNFTAAEKRETRQAEAAERAAVRAKRGPVGQLNTLDARLGSGVGAKKERSRLAKAVAAETDAILMTETQPKKRRSKQRRQPREQKR